MGDGDRPGLPDEHLVPGRGGQPCAELLQRLRADGYAGMVVLEVNTRRALSSEEREADLSEALAFTRHHLGQYGALQPATPQGSASRDRR